MRQLLRCCPVVAIAAFALPAQSPELEGVRPAVDRVVRSLGLDGAGLAVVREDGELHRSMHGALAADTVLPIASASKWLAVATVLTLVDDGVLELDHPVARYVEEFDRDDKRRITVPLARDILELHARRNSC